MNTPLSSTIRDRVSLAWRSFRQLLGVVTANRALLVLFVSLLVVDLFWIALFAVAKARYNLDIDTSLYERRGLRITTDRSIPEWFNYVKTLGVVIILGNLVRSTRQLIYVALTVIFVVVLLDDALEIHELVGGYFVDWLEIPPILGLRAQDVGEVITWAILGTLVMPLLLVGLRRACRTHLGTGLALLLPFGALLVCAIGIDQLYSNFHDAFPGAGIMLDMAEDGGEMIALTTALALAFGAERQRRTLAPGES